MSAEPNGFIAGAPWLLLVGGAPASGKTQLARQLAGRYRALLCTKDQFKEVLFDTLGTGQAASSTAVLSAEAGRAEFAPSPTGWSGRLSKASFALMFQLAPALLDPQRPLLLEGNFRPGEHEAPLAALLAARAGDPTRHPAHQDARIDVHRPAPFFLALPGARLSYDSDLDPQRAFEQLCSELDGRLPAL